MTTPYYKNLREPDETIRFPLITEDLVDVGDITVGRTIQEPGWRWSTHTRPLVGGDRCQARHVGVVLSGRFGVELQDGTTLEFGPDDVYDIPPGHDGYTIGDEPCVLIEWSGLRAFAGFRPGPRGRVLATLLLTELIEPHDSGIRFGEIAWRERMSAHLEMTRAELERHGGNEIKTTADGLLARFEGPAQALRCAAAIRRSAAQADLGVRSAIHVGEVDVVGNDVRGASVRAVARILAHAGENETLVSDVARALTLASGFSFDARGTHALQGLPGEWPLFAFAAEAASP